jgi:RNA polymerase sigma-70 factor (ECF subfamily)
MEDLEFIRKCIRRDKNSWDEFVQRYSRLIYSYIYNILKEKGISFEPSLVEDLFQEIFLHLIKDNFNKLRQYKAKRGCSFSGWLKVVVINFVLDFLRKREPRCVSLEESLQEEEELSLKDTLKDNLHPLPDELILDNESLESLSDCIRQLNKQDKFLIEMHIYRGMSLESLKTILKISRSAVDMRKQRVIEKLRDCFKEKGFQLEI